MGTSRFLVRRWVASFFSVALVAGGLSALVAAPKAGATGPVKAWDPMEVAPLESVSSTGPRLRTVQNDVVTEATSLAVSTTPILKWSKVPEGTQQVQFQVREVTNIAPRVIWTSNWVEVSGGAAQAKVTPGTLHNGQTYLWGAISKQTKDAMLGPFSLPVDIQRTDDQPLWAFSGIGVTEATGEPVVSWSSPRLATLGGGAGFTLLYRPSNAPQAGLPSGWSLTPVGQRTRWATLKRVADSSVVTLSTPAGWSVALKAVGGGAFEPMFGPGSGWPNGAAAAVFENPDGTFRVLDANAQVTSFPAPTRASPTVSPSSMWINGSAMLRQSYEQGKLQALTDPVSGRSITFHYSPSPLCPAQRSGFAPTPAGALCQVDAWDGSTTQIFYSLAGGTSEIARIVGYAGSGENAQVTDFGWDASQRLVGLRLPLANDAIAAGVIPGLSSSSAEAITAVTYDTLGSVASVTSPAGLVSGGSRTPSESTRLVQRFTYAEQEGKDVFTVKQNGIVPSAGFVERDDLDADSFQVLGKTGPSGQTSTSSYDPAGNAMLITNQTTGMKTKIVYNAQGRPIEEIGPTSGALESRNTPTLKTFYDQSESGVPFEGFSTHVWSNGVFNGSPVSGTIGPLLNGSTSPPSQVSFAYPASSSGPYSVQMSGDYVAADKGDYTFTNEAASATNEMFLNGAFCRPSCVVAVEKGQAVPLILVVRSTTGAAVNVQVSVAVGKGQPTPLPMSSIEPSLGLATSSSIMNQLSTTSGSQTLTAKTVYDPATGAPLKTITAAGTVSTISYAPSTGQSGQWGQLLSTTDPAGGVTSYQYYGEEQSSSACGVAAAQGGLLASVSDPSPSTGRNGLTSTQTYSASGGVVSQSAGGNAACVQLNSTGGANGASAAGVHDAYGVSTATMVDNNPLRSTTTTSTGGRVTKIEQSLNLNGSIVEMVDGAGTTTEYLYNPTSGKLDSMRESTRNGETRTTTYSYDQNAQLVSQTLNGHEIASYAYDRGGRLVMVKILASHTTERFTYNANGQVRGIVFDFGNGVTASEDDAYSAAGLLLRRVLTGPDGTADFSYAYDQNLRLIESRESGTIPVALRREAVQFLGAQGANGNRTSMTTEGPSGVSTTTYSYDQADRLIGSSSPSLAGGVTYSSADQTLRLGTSTLGYDAAGHVTSVSTGSNSSSLRYDSTGLAGFDVSAATGTLPTVPSVTSTTSPSTSSSSTSTTSLATTGGAVSPTTSATPSSVSTSSSTSTPTTGVGTSTTTNGGVSDAPTSSLNATLSGDLLLNVQGKIVGQVVTLSGGVVIGADATGVPAEAQYFDLVGSVAWQSKVSATPKSTTVYDPWGKQLSTSTQVLPSTPLEIALATNGWEAGSGVMTLPGNPGIDLIGNRAYSTEAGRFLQPDPVVGASQNRYEYGHGDPLNNSDPTGNMSLGRWIGLLVGVVVGTVVSMVTMGSATVALAGVGWQVFIAGAIAGAASGFVGSVTQQLIDTGTVEWKDALWSTGLGAAIGGPMNRVFLGTANLFKGSWLDAAVRPIATGGAAQVQVGLSFMRGSMGANAAGAATFSGTWTFKNVVGKGLFKTLVMLSKDAADVTGIWKQGPSAAGPTSDVVQAFSHGHSSGISSEAGAAGNSQSQVMSRNLLLAGGF